MTGSTINLLLGAEMLSGVAALVVTAMAFTYLSWSEGASSGAMQRASAKRAKRLFIWAGVLWAACVVSYLAQR